MFPPKTPMTERRRVHYQHDEWWLKQAKTIRVARRKGPFIYLRAMFRLRRSEPPNPVTVPCCS